MKMLRIPVLLSLMALGSSCNRVIYYGRSYPETTNPTLYFRESEVAEPFEEMGKATMEVSARRRSEHIQNKFVRKAESKGADAILFDDITLTNTGSTTGGAVAGAQVAHTGLFGLFGSRTKIRRGQLVKVTLLKYKRNIHQETF
jgi:hypothetical protein